MPAKFSRLLLILGLVWLSIGGVREYARNASQRIAMVPLPLDAAQPTRKRVGQLTFLGAWELRSDNSNFGGISALTLLPDDRFIGVGDAGTLIGFGLTNDAQIDRPFIAHMPGAFGKDVGYADRDSEGITFDPVTGRAWVSYEGHHGIRRFPASFARIDGEVFPAAMKTWSANRGAEAIARLPDGRFIVFSEGGGERDGEYAALLFSGDPVEQGSDSFGFYYRPPPGYRITDATTLPDGRLMTLHRRISFPDGFAAKIGIFDPAAIRRGATHSSKIIASLVPPLLVDNMEGITVREETDRLIIWIISDNNFNTFQRTLLMKFALPKKKPEADSSAPGFDSLGR
jgi:hypothetical protein